MCECVFFFLLALPHNALIWFVKLCTIEIIENVTCKLVSIFFCLRSFYREYILIDEFPMFKASASIVPRASAVFKSVCFIYASGISRNLNTTTTSARLHQKKNWLVVTLSNLRLTNHTKFRMGKKALWISSFLFVLSVCVVVVVVLLVRFHDFIFRVLARKNQKFIVTRLK